MILTGKCKEEWRSVIGYEKYYEISNHGNIRSKDRYSRVGYGKMKLNKGRVLKPYFNKRTGYMYIDFNINSKKIKNTIHRLVAIHFVDNPNNKPEVNHIDCNKLNNYYENLEWVTRSENTQHAYDNGLIYRGNRGGDHRSNQKGR